MTSPQNLKEQSKVGIIYLHGAGLHESIWSGVIKQSELPALAITLPTARKNFTFAEYTNQVNQQVQNWEVERFVIVAHSIGGILGMQLAEQFSDRVMGMIAVGAAIPKSGGSFLSIFPQAKRLIMQLLLRLFGTKPPESSIRQGLCNDFSDHQAKQIIENFVPESIHLYTKRLKVLIPDIPKLYVKLTNDQEFSPELQDQMIQNFSPQQVEILDSGHLPMLSQSDELRDILKRFVQEVS